MNGFSIIEEMRRLDWYEEVSKLYDFIYTTYLEYEIYN